MQQERKRCKENIEEIKRKAKKLQIDFGVAQLILNRLTTEIGKLEEVRNTIENTLKEALKEMLTKIE